MDNNRPYESTNNDFNHSTSSPMTLGDWVVTLLLLMIPVVRLVLLIVWAFSSETNENKKNFAKASLILMGIIILITIVFVACTSALILNSF
ncbi:hypothetical protein [Oceanirhabdus sp. W0125-5]|uniref:hypothetical protein n=1 Tax=Oceanirhabdus sp. W0125-5 TaxID=2999116 RepID=UPI0022F32BAA|nr:hypothetical protein [Oceanirhabdus sp. W0125-5]WBW99428.1 hypothetical protein OW730_11985 [Oceanirhabdus sp. W0125-5]